MQLRAWSWSIVCFSGIEQLVPRCTNTAILRIMSGGQWPNRALLPRFYVHLVQCCEGYHETVYRRLASIQTSRLMESH